MAKELPYLRPVPVENLSQAVQRLTGWMIPLAWVEALPDWANTNILRMVLWCYRLPENVGSWTIRKCAALSGMILHNQKGTLDGRR
jgi:hypothetical protein